MNLLGNLPKDVFFGYLIWALIAAFAMRLVATTRRDVESIRTPRGFDWLFFLVDNARRFFTAIILIVLTIRFAGEYVTGFWQKVFPLGVGLLADQLGVLFLLLSKVFSDRVKKWIASIGGVTVLLLMSAMFTGCQSPNDPNENISMLDAFRHCLTLDYYKWWVAGVTFAAVALWLILGYIDRNKDVNAGVKFFGRILIVFAWIISVVALPSDVSANTTVEQAARGAYYR